MEYKIYHAKYGTESVEKHNDVEALLGSYLYEKIFMRQYTHGAPSEPNTLFLSGSVIRHATNETIIFGCGVGSYCENIKIEKPKRIISVRGPLTHSELRKQNIDCPKI